MKPRYFRIRYRSYQGTLRITPFKPFIFSDQFQAREIKMKLLMSLTVNIFFRFPVQMGTISGNLCHIPHKKFKLS